MKCVFILLLGALPILAADTFTVASFNVENYFLRPFGTRKAKPPASQAKVREAILSIKLDVVALQEMGRRTALNALLAGLKAKGLNYPHIQ